MSEDFVDLAITPQEREDRATPAATSEDEPVYPFGTSISLENDQIEKLGLEDGEVGEYLHGEFYARLCGFHVTETESGSRKCMQIQIERIKLSSDEDDGDESPSSRDLYDDRE
jgi:hypothetical protein